MRFCLGFAKDFYCSLGANDYSHGCLDGSELSNFRYGYRSFSAHFSLGPAYKFFSMGPRLFSIYTKHG